MDVYRFINWFRQISRVVIKMETKSELVNRLEEAVKSLVIVIGKLYEVNASMKSTKIDLLITRLELALSIVSDSIIKLQELGGESGKS